MGHPITLTPPILGQHYRDVLRRKVSILASIYRNERWSTTYSSATRPIGLFPDLSKFGVASVPCLFQYPYHTARYYPNPGDLNATHLI